MIVLCLFTTATVERFIADYERLEKTYLHFFTLLQGIGESRDAQVAPPPPRHACPFLTV